jgi:phage tail sheath gpL-like
LVYYIASDSDMRMAVISAVLSGVATKQGISYLCLGDERMRMEINDLRREMRSLIRRTIIAILVIWGSPVLPVMMRVAGLI